MGFANPTYLWALTGLILPIAIHFWNKRKVRIVKIGSIQFLKEMEPRQSRSIALNEIWLLVFRMLVITILVLLLAAPFWKSKTANTAITYLLEPALMAEKGMIDYLATLDDAELRLLQNGFPELNDDYEINREEAVTPDYWQLAQQMELLATDSIIVLTKGYASGLKGKRPVVGAHIEWRIFNNDTELTTPIAALGVADSLQLIKVSSNPTYLGIKKEKLARNTTRLIQLKDSISGKFDEDDHTIPIERAELPEILIVYDEHTIAEIDIIMANLNAISKFTASSIAVNSTTDIIASEDHQKTCLIWLKPKPPEKHQGLLITHIQDTLANSLIVPTAEKNVYNITKTLRIDAVLGQHFGEELLRIIRPLNTIKERIAKYDKRVVDINEIKHRAAVAKSGTAPFKLIELRNWLWAFLTLLLIGERILSKIRKQ